MRLHISPDLLLRFYKSFTLGFCSGILFPKGGQNTILVTQIAKEKTELTIEAFRRTKEEELILYQVRLLWKPHFSLISYRTPQRLFKCKTSFLPVSCTIQILGECNGFISTFFEHFAVFQSLQTAF